MASVEHVLGYGGRGGKWKRSMGRVNRVERRRK